MFAMSFLLYQQKKTQVFITVHDFYGNQLYGVGHIGDTVMQQVNTVITPKCPFMSSTKLYARFCRYIRYTRKRGDENAVNSGMR